MIRMLGFAAALCALGASAQEIAVSADQMRLLELETRPAQAAGTLRLAGLPAQVEIAAGAQRSVLAPWSSQVLMLQADIGDRVAAGTPLAELASSEQAAAACRFQVQLMDVMSAQSGEAAARAMRAFAVVMRDGARG